MADENTCPHCGKPVPPTALGGICPECMLKAGLAAQTEGPGGTGPHGTKVLHPPPAPAEIAALFPQLEIVECLGRGGMGVVYKARQPRLNRLVALKILAREKEQDTQFAERFTREAQALARLNHPNIVTVYDFGETAGHCYLVMEFVDGLNLRQLLQTGKIPPEQALTIVPKICEALQYAHNEGIVHRDIKPENILLDISGRVKIADFGIAKMMGDEAGRQTLTGAKDAVGTPHYMAPEQIEKPHTVDHRADIYSLGVVFYEMLTGELPLGKFAPPSQKVQVDVRLDEVVLHALEKEPSRRYQQVSQVKTDVETIASTSAPAAAPAVPVEEILARDYTLNIRNCLRRGWALMRNHFWPLVGMSAFVLAVLAGASSSGFVISNGHSERSTSILGILLAGPLLGGLFLYFLKKIRGEAASVETAFTGFRQPLPHLVLASFVVALLTVLGFLCLILPGIYLLVAWKFTYPLIVDKGLDFWTAMRVSRKVISKHWWKFFGLVIVCALINLAGLLALIVGIFITSPITIAALMYAYEDVIGAVKIPSGVSPSVPPIATPVPPVVPPLKSGFPRVPPGNRPFFRRGVLAGLSVFVLVVIVASIITFLLPKVYVGDTRVRVLSPPPLQYYNPYLVQNEFQVIQSTVVPKVAASLNLAERWGKEYAGGHTLTDLETYNLMLRSLDLEPVRNTIFIDIRFYSRSPTEAAEIANKIAETYCALPPGHRGEIVRLAEPASRPVRPNVPKNIFAGVLAGGVVGILTGLAVGLFSFWRLRAAQSTTSPPAPEPDRFWRRFAVTVLALIILIPTAIYILAILLPIGAHFAFDRRTQEQEQPVNESIRSDYIGQTWFPQDDSIEITSVERSENQMTVKGHYNLVSHDNALLALYITTMTNIAVPVGPNERMQISKGQGEFELTDPHLVPGLPHVSMYANGHPFASLYFGTEAEALEESKASWITNTSPAATKQPEHAVDFASLLNDDQRAVLAWTGRQFRNYLDTRTFEDWSDQERAELEARSLDALHGPISDEYYQAINTLAALHSTKALPTLREIAFDHAEKDNRDRWTATRALGIIGDKASVPDLIHLLYHYNVNTRWWAQISLVRLTGTNFGTDWNAWGKWWNDQNGQPPFNPGIIRWRSEQPEPDKLAESLNESDNRWLANIRDQAQTGEKYLQQQLKLANAGNYWAKFQLWQAFSQGEVPVFDLHGNRTGKHEVTKDLAKADKWLAELVKGAYLAKFEPVNGFNPSTPKEMLDQFDGYCHLYSGRDSLGGASFFRTTKQDGKLIGSFLTEFPDQFKTAIEKDPNLKLISIEKVTPEMFLEHEASSQESL